MKLVGLTRLNTAQDGDQARGEGLLVEDLADPLLLGNLAGIQKLPRAMRTVGERLGALEDAAGQVEGVLFEAFEQDLADEEIAQQDGGLVEGAKGATKAQAVEAGKNADDIGGMFCYKGVGDVVGRGIVFHNATLASSCPQRHALFWRAVWG